MPPSFHPGLDPLYLHLAPSPFHPPPHPHPPTIPQSTLVGAGLRLVAGDWYRPFHLRDSSPCWFNMPYGTLATRHVLIPLAETGRACPQWPFHSAYSLPSLRVHFNTHFCLNNFQNMFMRYEVHSSTECTAGASPLGQAPIWQANLSIAKNKPGGWEHLKN